jgi:hypothetical protein
LTSVSRVTPNVDDAAVLKKLLDALSYQPQHDY